MLRLLRKTSKSLISAALSVKEYIVDVSEAAAAFISVDAELSTDQDARNKPTNLGARRARRPAAPSGSPEPLAELPINGGPPSGAPPFPSYDDPLGRLDHPFWKGDHPLLRSDHPFWDGEPPESVGCGMIRKTNSNQTTNKDSGFRKEEDVSATEVDRREKAYERIAQFTPLDK
ncbi:hypothetical protein M406DRAFT_75175 [Cryphonectria parasitica EP155]|uniref:Uncharacterized protein n=1 Tax=Cryphonectria parasitica (strain ATCC 38755 / EP155) TaxID=660469 RepID=A0A9P4XZW0_CRYP1|nr:uncharacterized protein M406DRAFT_75175 [Cryphonectria parasitica EP155]KAF3763949.1 hypothetical protein M406DRAFT_75175 [Cryphonectria parasitica EP155]